MENVNLLESPAMIALAIFHEFDNLQSCTITGFVQLDNGRLERKGDTVLRELEMLDSKHNYQPEKIDKRPRRKRYKPPNTIGGYVAQKIWKYRHEVVGNEPKTHIWRIQ